MLKRNDILLVIFLVALSLAPLALLRQSAPAAYAEIKVDGFLLQTVPLDKDNEITVETSYGKNILKIKNGKIKVIYSDCTAGTCMKSGAIKSSGEMIACLPHHLLIEVKGSDSDVIIAR